MESGWRSAKPRKKTQQEKRNEKKMRSSYFTQQYEAYGENFSNFKTPQDIRRESYKIFKALADGAIDLEKHSKCFEDPIFINALKDIAYEKMVYHYCTQLGLEQTINNMLASGMYVEGFLYNNFAQHQKSTECYTLIYQAFQNIQLTRDYITVLCNLMPMLNKYRQSL